MSEIQAMQARLEAVRSHLTPAKNVYDKAAATTARHQENVKKHVKATDALNKLLSPSQCITHEDRLAQMKAAALIFDVGQCCELVAHFTRQSVCQDDLRMSSSLLLKRMEIGCMNVGCSAGQKLKQCTTGCCERCMNLLLDLFKRSNTSGMGGRVMVPILRLMQRIYKNATNSHESDKVHQQFEKMCKHCIDIPCGASMDASSVVLEKLVSFATTAISEIAKLEQAVDEIETLQVPSDSGAEIKS